jgi:death-on-curing protein
MIDPSFLSLEDILSIHEQEIKRAGGEPNIRESESIEACVDAPNVTFDGKYLNNLFEMAATYISCLTIRHPFVDGNKRTARRFISLGNYQRRH